MNRERPYDERGHGRYETVEVHLYGQYVSCEMKSRAHRGRGSRCLMSAQVPVADRHCSGGHYLRLLSTHHMVVVESCRVIHSAMSNARDPRKNSAPGVTCLIGRGYAASRCIKCPPVWRSVPGANRIEETCDTLDSYSSRGCKFQVTTCGRPSSKLIGTTLALLAMATISVLQFQLITNQLAKKKNPIGQ